MTQSGMHPTPNTGAPEVTVAATLAASAGTSASIPVTVRHRGPVPAILRITVLGLDSRWAPEPVDLGPVEPGETTGVVLTLVPERGAMGARYPFAVAVEATPLYGGGAPLMGIAESVLVVDSQERIAMAIQPPTPVAIFSRKFDVQITNPGTVDRDFELVPSSAHGASVSLARDQVRVPAQRTLTVRGRVRVRHPTFLGGDNTFTFGVTARGLGAPEFAEGTVRARPVVGRGLRIAIGLIAVLAVWAAAAIIFIPKISDRFTPKVAVAAPATATSAGPSAVTGTTAGGGTGAGATTGAGSTGGGSGSGGSGSGDSGDSGGSGGSGGSGSGGAGGANAAGYQVAGTIGGPSPAGTTVSLVQVTLAEAAQSGASAAPGTNTETGNALRGDESDAFAKVPGSANGSVPRNAPGTGTLTTKADGGFQFAGVQAPGYYLLTTSKSGFQTQKFLIDSTDLASPQPIKVTMAPANGELLGSITDSSGQPIGAATITITDGTVSLQTSSVSSSAQGAQGTPGSFLVNGVSTPGTYLVTASAPGFGTESSVVELGAGGKGSANLTLKKGVGAIVGAVTGGDGTRLGGITISATNGTVTSTATTVTAGPVGSFTLPDLPVPGDYIVTISGDGYQTQTHSVSMAAGVGSATLNVTLVATQGRVTGSVLGKDLGGKSEGTLVGVGMTLTNSQNTYKTMTTSEPKGQFDFTGVPPGTYVLTASQFGRQPASATVHVVAAKTSTQSLTLIASSSTVLPPDSFIKGSVIDSRASGPLTCDRAALPVAKADCVATVTVATFDGTVKATTKTAPDFTYQIPDSTNVNDGLTPGLYTVTVTAPGYEPSVVQVQLGQSQTATAPPVSMAVLGLVSGTITTRVGTPVAPSCVVAIPVATTVTTIPTTCTPGSTRTTCAVPGLGTLPCGLTSMGGAAEAPAGTYAIRGLTHGAYQLFVVAQDPEYRYVITNLPTVQIPLGGDAQFNAVLDRLGRVQLTVRQVNQASGQLNPAAGATVTVTDPTSHKPVTFGQIPCDSHDTAPPGHTCTDGSATLTGLNGDVVVAVTGAGGRATVTTQGVGLNQTVPVSMTLSESVGPFVGRVTTTGIDGSAIGLSGASVTVTGTVDYSGTTAVSGTATVTTDGHGCYAIVPADYTLPTGVTLTSADCPSVVPAGSTAVASNPSTGQDASFRVDRVSIAVAALGNRSEALPTTGATITGSDTVRVVPTFSVAPKPVNFGSEQKLTIAGPPGFTAPDLSTANISIVSKPALAGPAKITATQTTPGQIPGGVVSTALTFVDPSITPQVGITFPAMPGRYSLQVTLPGFVTANVDLLCPLGDPGNLATTCTFVKTGTSTPTPLRLNQLPSVTGSMTAPALPPDPVNNPTGKPDWSDAVVTMVTGPTSLGNLAMVASVSDPFTGIVTFDGATSAIAAAGGKYTFTIALPGYATAPVTVNCGADFTSAPAATFGCTPLTPTAGVLTRLPSFQGTLTMGAPSGVDVPVTSATVTAVDTVNSSNTVSVTVNADGSLTWTDAPQPPGIVVPGSYAVTYTAPGFSSRTVTFNCNAGASCGPGAQVIKMLPLIGGTISLSGAVSGVTVDSTVITLGAQHPPNVGAVTVNVNGSGTVSYTDANRPAAGTNGLPGGLALPGTYTFNVSLTGYQSKTVTVVCGDDYQGGATPPSGNVNGCTPLNATLNPLPSFDSASSLVTLSSLTSPYGDVTFDTSNVVATVTPNAGNRIAATVDGTGHVQWLDSTTGVLPGQVVPGTYTITYSFGGFKTGTATVTCLATATTCTAGTTPLLMLPKGLGTVTIPLPPGATDLDLTKATVTANSPPAAGTSVSGLHLSLSETANDGTNITAAIIWTDSRQPFAGVIQPDTYTVTVKLAGYKNATSSAVACTYGGACSPALTLIANPPFAGQISILPAGLTAPTIAVSTPSGVGAVSLTSDTSGNMTWQQTGMPQNVVQPGNYTVQVQLTGYDLMVDGTANGTGTFPFSCTDVSCTFPQLTLTAPTNLTVNLVNQLSGGDAPTKAGVRIYTTGTSPKPGFATGGATWDLGSKPTTAPTNYTLDVQAAGFTFADGLDHTSTSTVTCTNGATTEQGLVLIPGGTTTCTVTLQQLGTITAQTSWDMIDIVGNHISYSDVGAIAVTAQLLSAGTPTGPVFTGTSSSTGALTLTGTTTTEGLASGQYQIKASPTGFTPFVGTITIDDNHDMVSEAGDVEVDTGIAQIRLETASNLSLKVTLNSSANTGTAIMPDVTITLTDAASNALTCKTTATVGPDCTVTNTSTDKFVTFTGLPPGNYQATVVSNDGSFSNLGAQPIQLLPAASTARTATLTLTPLVSSMTGAVVDPNHVSIQGAKVQLWPWQGTGPATDFNGDPFPTITTPASGLFNFGLIPDANSTTPSPRPQGYQIVVDAPGYQRVISGIIPVTYPNPIAAQTVATTTATYRNTTLTFPSPAASLSGATVTLTPVAGTSKRTPDNTTMSSIPITGAGTVASPWTANIPQLPTGKWTVSVIRSGSPFPVDANETLDATESADKSHPQPVLNAALTLNEATTSFEFDWTSELCIDDPSAISIQVARSDVATPLTLPLTVDATNHKATGSALLPPGTYTWNAPTSPAGWKTPATDTSVTVADPAAAVSTSADLTAITATVTVTLTVNGAAASATYNGATVTPTCVSNSTAAPVGHPTAGTVTFDLAANSTQWNFAIAGTTASPISIDPQSGVTVTAGGPNTVTFAGHTLQPKVELATVTGRPSDSRAVAVGVYAGATATGTPVFTASPAVTGAAGYTGPTLLLGGTTYSVAATPPDTDVFGADSDLAIDVTGTHTSSLTLPYQAAIARVTTVVNGTNQTGASVSLTPGGNPSNPVPTGAGGVATIYDLDPSSTSTITASYTASGPTVHYTGSGSVTVGAAGSTTDATVTLAPVPGIVVTVTDSGSALVSGATATVFNASGTQVATGTTDANGIARLGPLTANTDYYLLVTSGTTISPYTLVHTDSSATTLTTTSVTLGAAASVSLTATAPVGTAGAQVGVPATVTVKANGHTLQSALTAANNGTLTITGLPPNSSLTIGATWIDTTPNPDVTYSGTATPTTGAAGSTTSGVSIAMTTP